MYAFVILVYLIITLIELIPLIKTNKKKESVLYSFVMVSSFTISILLVAGVQLPSPADFIEDIISTFIKND
jgi:RsiW-degrading membrane proteinase PrsW (M82 family)